MFYLYLGIIIILYSIILGIFHYKNKTKLKRTLFDLSIEELEKQNIASRKKHLLFLILMVLWIIIIPLIQGLLRIVDRYLILLIICGSLILNFFRNYFWNIKSVSKELIDAK